MKRLFLLTAALVLLFGLDMAVSSAPRRSGAYEPALDGMPRRRRPRRRPRHVTPQQGNTNPSPVEPSQPTPPAGDNSGGSTVPGTENPAGGDKVEGPDAIREKQEGPTGTQSQNFTGSGAPKTSTAPANANKNARGTTGQPNKNTQPPANVSQPTPPERQKQ